MDANNILISAFSALFVILLAIIAFFLKTSTREVISQMKSMQSEQQETTKTLIKISLIQDQVVKQQRGLMTDVTGIKVVLSDHSAILKNHADKFRGIEIHMNNSVGK